MQIFKRILLYFFVFIVMLQCHSLLNHMIPNKYFLVLIFCLIIILIFFNTSIRIKIKNCCFLIIYIIAMAILIFFGDFKNIEFIMAVVSPFILCIIYFSDGRSLEDILEVFANIMFMVSVLSLLFFLLGSCLEIIKPTAYYTYQTIGWGTNNYRDWYHLYCEGQSINIFGYSGVRNIGLFVEGPMLAYPLIIVFYYEFFLRPKSYRKSYLVVYILTMLTSFSTTALILLVVMVVLKVYLITQEVKLIKYLLIPIIGICALIIGVQIIQDKLIHNTISANIRIDDIVASLKCFSDNILIGNGFENMEGLNPYRQYIRLNAGLSSGVGGILAFGGTTWGFWYIVPFILAVKTFIQNKEAQEKMGFIIVAFVLLCVTVVQTRVLCTMINAITWSMFLEKDRYFLRSK